jgi:sterol desaturase/sphingolipid hydroxylase (fatty acid hydroxylase superfamily)
VISIRSPCALGSASVLARAMSLSGILFLVLLASLLLEVLLTIVYVSRTSDAYKIYSPRPKDIARAAKLVVPNSLLSGGLIFGILYVGSDWLIHGAQTSALELVADVVVTLALYDLLYYFMHRYLFHEWQLLRSIHVLHHTVKYPVALESLYVHPIENSLGLLLLTVCIAIVGPVSMPAYLVLLAIYSWLNIVIHSGLDFRHPMLRPVAYMVRKHAKHHSSMRAGNYASITPLPDVLFRTLD